MGGGQDIRLEAAQGGVEDHAAEDNNLQKDLWRNDVRVRQWRPRACQPVRMAVNRVWIIYPRGVVLGDPTPCSEGWGGG